MPIDVLLAILYKANMDEETPLQRAVRLLGGQSKAAKIMGRNQSSISEALSRGQASPELCMRIETALNGVVTCEELRPDLADLFKALRRPGRRKSRSGAQQEAAA